MAAIANQTDNRQKKDEGRLASLCDCLGIDFRSPEDLVRSLPFSGNDTTAGLENEMQTAVRGPADRVDLPILITSSNYYKNIQKRALSGDNAKELPERIRRYVEDNPGQIWENSWVRFDAERLSPYAELVFNQDLRHNRKDPKSPRRSDAASFFVEKEGRTLIRVPVSYMFKLALADIIGSEPDAHSVIKVTGENLMSFYLSDNTSPEILSFYRELFMSPCLSGWDKGEEKKEYMGLCPRVLSRSQLNAVAKLRDAGIITRNLVVLPTMSNISLANNGTHVSLGSRKLSEALTHKDSGFTTLDEKKLGDLVIKITEHFLPLFVGTYSASPYRLSFSDFHPEKVLAFLPHELDFSHLRMIWRRWKKKAKNKILGKTVTPFGPELMDRMISKLFRLKGDMIPDYRLIDYFACLMSTGESPALDGKPGNDERLKKDLADMGIFDTSMSLYLFYRMRAYEKMGFSGFEGRFHSLFHSFKDLAHAIDLQMLVTALAYQYVLTGQVTHESIPDDPLTESERRQIFFGRAIGIPTFYVHKDSTNSLLSSILKHTAQSRQSRRYPDYVRVLGRDYCTALLAVLKEDGQDLIRKLGIERTVKDLEVRLLNPQGNEVSDKIDKDILDHVSDKGKKRVTEPLSVPADEYNAGAEEYFRDVLRKQQMAEALNHVKESFATMELWVNYRETSCQEALHSLLGKEGPQAYLFRMSDKLLSEDLGEDELLILARLLILQIYFDRKKQNKNFSRMPGEEKAHPPQPLTLKTVFKG